MTEAKRYMKTPPWDLAFLKLAAYRPTTPEFKEWLSVFNPEESRNLSYWENAIAHCDRTLCHYLEGTEEHERLNNLMLECLVDHEDCLKSSVRWQRALTHHPFAGPVYQTINK